MSGLNCLKLGSTLSNICNSTQLDDATTPSKISGENPALLECFVCYGLSHMGLAEIGRNAAYKLKNLPLSQTPSGSWI